MGSRNTLRTIASIAAPIAGTLLLPGIGTALGISGLTAAAGGATTLGGALGGGIGGLAGGALSGGGLSGALRGGALGAAGGYLSSGGASDLIGGTAAGRALGLSAPEGGSVLGNALGSTAGSAGSSGFSGLLSGGGAGVTSDGLRVGQAYDTASLSGLSSGSGIGSGLTGDFARGLGGSVSAPTSSLASALSSGSGGGASAFGGVSPLSIGGTLLGGINSMNATEKARKDLLNANNAALAQLQPYQATGAASNTRLSELLGTGGNSGAEDYGSLTEPFNPGDLTQDPGYQFQLSEGERALGRAQGARGNYFSGAALRAAQDYGTGLADQTYRDAYARDAAQREQTYNMYAGQAGQGLNAAGGAANINQNTGMNQANAGIAGSNNISQMLSSLLSGSGARRPVNIGGQIVYV